MPCDLYAAAGTPCVAAHSLAPALSASYNGPLYQVQGPKDAAKTNIGLLSAGGAAQEADHGPLCSGAPHLIPELYPPSPRPNDLPLEGG
ncbi:alpha-L-arabinofuranosidase, partial [Streptomyces antibioticus]